MEQSIRETLRELVQIPAPYMGEAKRADYCRNWLSRHGISDPVIDEENNVIASYHMQPGNNNILFMAHLDTVFPEDTPLDIEEKDGRWCCPGIGDDTANAVAMMAMMERVWKEQPRTECGAVFALDVGEEGLGNLRGCRKVMETFTGRVRAVISFDLYQERVYTGCIGSVRYRLSVRTPGGHSFHKFGSPNAIAVLSEVLTDLYRYRPEKTAGGPVTYNVGMISGGTSVNTIAQEASALFEYRAEVQQDMQAGMNYLKKTVEAHRAEQIEIHAELIGERPCMEAVNPAAMRKLAEICGQSVQRITGIQPVSDVASTDCNIPLSMGIPAVCVGLVRGGGAHTREEWIEIDSLEDGCKIAWEIVCGSMQKKERDRK